MDGFVDGIITITVDYKHWIDCAKGAALLVIHTLFRPLHPSESQKQYDPISLRKLAGWGEGGGVQLAEHKTCLGWDINTHSMRLFLPEEKQIAWTTDIKETLASKKIKTDTLEFLLELMPLLYQWYRMLAYLLVGILSDSEFLCPTLGLFCGRLVVPPQSVSLRKVDHLISGVLMVVVVGRVYG